MNKATNLLKILDRLNIDVLVPRKFSQTLLISDRDKVNKIVKKKFRGQIDLVRDDKFNNRILFVKGQSALAVFDRQRGKLMLV